MDDKIQNIKAVENSFQPKVWYKWGEIEKRSGVFGEFLAYALQDLEATGRLRKGYQKGELYPRWNIQS